MLKSHFIEDIFLEFIEFAESNLISLHHQDRSAATNFYNVIASGKALTENQASYILKILEKNKNVFDSAGFDYKQYTIEPKWKNAFRIIDLSKKIFVETDEDNRIWICIKFPYHLKKSFEDEFGTAYSGVWDPERSIRKLSFYDVNMIQLHEFVKENNFEIDETFLIAFGEVEEIWRSEEQISPYCDIINNQVVLINSNSDTDDWFKLNSNGVIDNDLLIAKSMGFPFRGTLTNTVTKIAASDENLFWIKDNIQFLDICKNVEGNVCIVLDRAGDINKWVRSFIGDVETTGFDKNLVKVCFRFSKDEDNGFNQWVTDTGVGGKVGTGKIFIFNNKPAKWLFKDNIPVTMLVSNNLYPSTTPTTREWFITHPCVILLGDIKPTESRKQKIVEL